MKPIPTRKTSRRVFLISLFVAIGLCLLGIWKDSTNFIGNIIAELTGIAVGIVLAVSILDWYDERRKRDEWKYVITLVGPGVFDKLHHLIRECIPVLFHATGYYPGIDLESSVEFHGNLMLHRGVSPLVPFLKEHIECAFALSKGETPECHIGTVGNKKKPEETSSQARSLRGIVQDLVQAIRVFLLPRLSLTDDSEGITLIVALEKAGNDFISLLDSMGDKSLWTESDQRKMAMFLAVLTIISVDVHDWLLRNS